MDVLLRALENGSNVVHDAEPIFGSREVSQGREAGASGGFAGGLSGTAVDPVTGKVVEGSAITPGPVGPSPTERLARRRLTEVARAIRCG